jgi:putative ABC transport system substrate-binding protein
MIRRDFLGLLAGVASWPLAAKAQAPAPAKLPTIGFLSTGSQRTFAKLVAAFNRGLSDNGYVEGRDIFIDYRWAEGHYDELNAMAADLVRKQVTLIAATGGVVSARAALKSTREIPVLFVVGFDPVQLGLVKSLNQPGGNATGASVYTTEIAAKRLELLLEILPSVRTVGHLVNPGAEVTNIEIKDIIAGAQRTGHAVEVLKAGSESELDAAFASAASRGVGALVVSADPLFTSRRALIVNLAARYAIPTIYPWREYVEAGGLMSYGTELTWAYQQVGGYASRILKGTRPEDLPVELPTRFDLLINMRTAKALNLTILPSVLARADQVLE